MVNYITSGTAFKVKFFRYYIDKYFLTHRMDTIYISVALYKRSVKVQVLRFQKQKKYCSHFQRKTISVADNYMKIENNFLNRLN